MAQAFNTNLKNVASIYLRLLKVKVTVSSVKKDIEENPYFPSLLSLSDTFNRYHINNSAFEVGPEILDLVTPPFVAYVFMPGIGKDFILVSQMADQTVTYFYNNGAQKIISKQEFLQRYKGIVWAAEPNQNSKELGFEKKRLLERIIAFKNTLWLVGAGILVVFAVVFNLIVLSSFFAYLSILFLKFLGICAVILLLVYEIDENNVFVRNICSSGKQTNCGAVLGSRASKIFGISWGEIGFFYFVSTCLWLLFPAISLSDKFSCSALANIAAATYIPFSIYYQLKVVKQWCPLCLMVQAVLFSELIWSIVYFWSLGHSLSMLLTIPHLFTLLKLFICFLTPVVVWTAIKPLFRKSKDARIYEAAYKRLQYNPEIFKSLLQQQSKVHEGWQQLGIDIGNPTAENIIIKICDPYCSPCANAHPILEDLIKDKNNTRLKIIFRSKNGDKKGAEIVKHLLAIAAEGNETNTQKALDDWYLAKEKNYAAFATKYTPNENQEQEADRLNLMTAWCKTAEIQYTPMFFINGFRLPENYELKELKYIL